VSCSICDDADAAPSPAEDVSAATMDSMRNLLAERSDRRARPTVADSTSSHWLFHGSTDSVGPCPAAEAPVPQNMGAAA
jgi:hypothetical protein